MVHVLIFKSNLPLVVKGYALSAPTVVRNSLGLSKSFYSPLADTNDFSADISVRSRADSELYDVARGAFAGSAQSNFPTCRATSGDPSKELLPGDLISFIDDENLVNSAVVEFVTKPVGYGTSRARARVYLTTSLLIRLLLLLFSVFAPRLRANLHKLWFTNSQRMSFRVWSPTHKRPKLITRSTVSLSSTFRVAKATSLTTSKTTKRLLLLALV